MSMKIVQFSRPLQDPLVHVRPNFFNPLDIGRPIPNEPPILSPNDNQSLKRKHNPRMANIYYQVLASGCLLFSVSIH